MKELLVITVVAVAVTLVGWGLYLGLGYTQAGWSMPMPYRAYVAAATQHGSARQVSGESAGSWYPPLQGGHHTVSQANAMNGPAAGMSLGAKAGRAMYYTCWGMSPG